MPLKEKLKVALQNQVAELSVRTLGEMEEQGVPLALVFDLPPKQSLQATMFTEQARAQTLPHESLIRSVR